MVRRRSRGRSREQVQAPDTAGPAWRRIDLHLHTPGSSDYQEPPASYLDILLKAEARGLDIIAFTDHNSVAGYAAMRREIEHLEFLEGGGRLLPDEARRLAEYRRVLGKVLVLPGFEFTATFGFHILGVFPPDTSVRKLEHILLELNVPEEKLDLGSSEVGATSDVLRAYEVIAEAGGLVIGAHVNSTHGIAMIGLGFGGQTRIAYTQDPNLHALEVTDLESTGRRTTARFFNGSKPEYPRRMHCIQGSDAHRVTRDPQHPEKNLGVGDRCTEVLLPEVGFAALKALFTSTDFGHTRPYRPTEDPFDPLKAARAEGNTIVQAFHETAGVGSWQRAPLKGLLKDIVAFANTNGGVLYVGASADPDAPIRGVEHAAEVAQQIRADAARLIVPPLEPEIETLTSEGKAVLVVTVPKGTDTPYALDPGYIYVRQEGETTLALRDEIVQLVRASFAPQTVGLDPGQAPPATVAPPWSPLPTPPAPPPVAVRQGQNGRLQGAPAPQAADRQASQQAAVRQASAAERERQQERTPVPRTGVELIAATERDGVLYHTVRDLRNRRAIRNVTRASARRLWRYALIQAEEHPVRPEEVHWDEHDPRFGFWKGYRQADGMRRYNLVYREQPGNGAQEAGSGGLGDQPGERLRVFYGVTEDGIDDRWRGVLPPDSELPEVHYDDSPASLQPADRAGETAHPTAVLEPVPSAPAQPNTARAEPMVPAAPLHPGDDLAAPIVPASLAIETALPVEAAPVDEPPAPSVPVAVPSATPTTPDEAPVATVAAPPEQTAEPGPVETEGPARRTRRRRAKRPGEPPATPAEVEASAPEPAVPVAEPAPVAMIAGPREPATEPGPIEAEAAVRPARRRPATRRSEPPTVPTPSEVAAPAPEPPVPVAEPAQMAEETPAPAPKRRRSTRRAQPVIEPPAEAPVPPAEVRTEAPAEANAPAPVAAPPAVNEPGGQENATPAKTARRRRSPRKAATAEPPQDDPTEAQPAPPVGSSLV